ncbi:hypothetical protein Vretifemale_4205, partial [Volvox reticuliferus]
NNKFHLTPPIHRAYPTFPPGPAALPARPQAILPRQTASKPEPAARFIHPGSMFPSYAFFLPPCYTWACQRNPDIRTGPTSCAACPPLPRLPPAAPASDPCQDAAPFSESTAPVHAPPQQGQRQ